MAAAQQTQQKTLGVPQAAHGTEYDVSKYPNGVSASYTAHDFQFADGEKLAELRLHYVTLGTPHRNVQGHVDNAVMILHGTGGSAEQFLGAGFAGVLFGPGQLLDAARYYIILPDSIGHGDSSKPSDGLHMRFPRYDYDDMVRAQHVLLTEGLHVDHARLILGTSMGCMHAFVWGEAYPAYADALMPLACQPVEIAGRNRMTRKMVIENIESDPTFHGGEYTAEPTAGLRAAEEIVLLMGSSPLQMQEHEPTRDAADQYLDKMLDSRAATLDANDMIYQFASSRNYNPFPKLGTITAPLLQINSADDFINPPELHIADRDIHLVPHGQFVLLPITEQTRGHGTHTLPAIWQGYLKQLLDASAAPVAR
ncbi:alpha/beta fold hydrolase [Acidipila sp. EB88]|uniref:alpha/beta fold hydrolase n=1 Tax=Acidipila sp. EB88 TaxID=2305226 RepID=UPI000F5EAE4B|nr:alpha/beta fold hydrolase [Acidipila sp. EB88]RRA48128.1 alpha/beta fold hydrolase [Acidipila sp. EB88]